MNILQHISLVLVCALTTNNLFADDSVQSKENNFIKMYLHIAATAKSPE